MSYYKILFLLFSYFIFTEISAQDKTYKTAVIMFYNVENLYDTIKSADIINGNLSPENSKYQISVPEDSALASGLKVYKGPFRFDRLKGKSVIRKQILTNEFYYKGKKLWNSKKYREKVGNLVKVMSEVGKSETQTPPAIIGLAEIENEHVLKDLCSGLETEGRAYGFVHFNSFDARGIDVALLYDKSRFVVENQRRVFIDLAKNAGVREYTRDILLVEGLLDGERMYFLVNHWPSRRGGEQASMPKRMAAAEVMKKEMDSIQAINPKAKILAMGDFNDDPTSPSMKKVLHTIDKKSKVTEDAYFNPAESLFKKGMGTLAYQDSFNFFDQQIMSRELVKGNSGYVFYKMSVFSPVYLITQEGPWKGYPFRTFNWDVYTGGYSDHFPVYTILVREMEK